MKGKNIYVGIDLGGTAIKLAFVDEDGVILARWEEPTRKADGPDQVVQQMNAMIEQGLQSLSLPLTRKQLAGVGIGAPAFLDIETGYVYEAVNLGWKDYPLKDQLESHTGLPVFIDNDANTAALGEMWKGAGEGLGELLCITLGTGVGGGVILNGKIHHGARGMSGEIGHVTVVPEGGYRCNCGKYGCLETVASATGMVRMATDALQGEGLLEVSEEDRTQSSLRSIIAERSVLQAKDVVESAAQGDELAKLVIEKVADTLGMVLGNYTVIMNPGRIVIGGGVSKAGDLLFNPIRQAYRKYALTHLTGDIDIVPATLGNDAGVVGAAWLAHTKA